MTAGIQTLAHVGIMVSDLERSLAFYHDVLGLEFVASEEHIDGAISKMTATANVHLREYRLRPSVGIDGYARMQGPGFTFDLLQWVTPPSAIDRGPISRVPSSHICFGVADLPATYERLLAAQVECVSPPVRFTGEGEWHVMFLYDPDGNLVELNEIGTGVQPTPGPHHHPWSRF